MTMGWITMLVLLSMSGLFWLAWAFRSGNAGLIDVDLLWLRVANVEVWSALAAALAAGLGIGATLVGFAWLRQRILNRRHRKTIERLENEVHRLRSLPAPTDLQGTDPAAGKRPASMAGWLGRTGFGRG